MLSPYTRKTILQYYNICLSVERSLCIIQVLGSSIGWLTVTPQGNKAFFYLHLSVLNYILTTEMYLYFTILPATYFMYDHLFFIYKLVSNYINLSNDYNNHIGLKDLL